jgi:type IX secretion system PorP/SprF family membrane protein
MKKSILLLAGLGLVTNLFSQQIPQYSQYYINPFIYNPSFAGAEETVNTYLVHRSLFQKFPGAPVTNAFTIDGALPEKNVGLGLSLYNDATDIINKMGVSSAYSYKLELNSDMHVNFGLAIGVSETRVDFSKAVVKDVNDPFLMKQVQRKMNVDADFGVSYFWKDLVVSAAVPQLLEHKARFESNDARTTYQAKRHILAAAKYSFEIDKGMGIKAYPLVLVRYAPGVPFSYDINAVAEWENKGWFGVSYKNDYAVGLNLGVRLNKTLSAGYTYDIITSPIKAYAGISHEILLGYSFGGKKAEPVPEPVANQASEARVTDLEGVVNSQKQQIEANKTEIEKLKTEMEKMKGGVADTSKSAGVNKNNLTGFVTVGVTSDFTDKDGNKPKAGHYLIIGTFSKQENADKTMKSFIDKGYKDVTYVKNKKTDVTYVYVKMTEQAAEMLIDDLNKVRKDAPDSWIYHLED